MSTRHHVFREMGIRPIIVTLASGYNKNLLTVAQAIYGTITAATNATFIVPGGVLIGSTSVSVASLRTGSWPAGSLLTLINNGTIAGRGGDGDYSPTGGGDAILLDFALSIDNTYGLIGGGGGGGGQGNHETDFFFWGVGGGGGGGQGHDGGTGGAAAGPAAADGASGDIGGPGAGGGPSASGPNGYYGGGGGLGGALGAAGGAASSTTPNGYAGSGGSGAGRAVNRAGFALTWIAGNNSTHVKGAIV